MTAAHADRPVIEWCRDETRPSGAALIAEEPLAIRVEGRPYAVIMRTPGDEPAHAAGFCLAEGIADRPEDIAALGLCDDGSTNVVTVTLSPARRSRVGALLERRGYISQTSCGICGKEIVDDLYQQIRPIERPVAVDPQAAWERLENMDARQPLRRRTRAAHAALIFDERLALLAGAEDVGRHNALDKAIGRLFLDRRLEKAALLVLSSRISYELVQKAARARIAVILAQSRPTALAVDLAARLRMTLATRRKGAGLVVYTCPERLGISARGGPS